MNFVWVVTDTADTILAIFPQGRGQQALAYAEADADVYRVFRHEPDVVDRFALARLMGGS